MGTDEVEETEEEDEAEAEEVEEEAKKEEEEAEGVEEEKERRETPNEGNPVFGFWRRQRDWAIAAVCLKRNTFLAGRKEENVHQVHMLHV